MGPAYFWVYVWGKEVSTVRYMSPLYLLLCMSFFTGKILWRCVSAVCHQWIVSFLCATANGDGVKHTFCEDLGGHTQAEAAQCNARLSRQCLMAAADIAFKQ